MFSITFTKSQAEQFIKESLHKNFINVPEFIVRISDEEGGLEIKKYIKEFSSGSELKVETKDEAEVNPWLVPDENGWFTHDPAWESEHTPPYIEKDKKVNVILRDDFDDHSDDSYLDYAKRWNWSVDEGPSGIIKWKYA